jgi:cytochrome P450
VDEPLPDEWWQHHFDPNSAELAPRLYETLAPMRERCPVARSNRYEGFWVVTRYEDVLAVAQDWQTFSSAHGLTVQAIRGGDKVVLYWASANRDRAEFSAPDEFDLGREHNRHFAFGVGPHRCAGSNLARLNLRIGLEEALRRLHDIRLAGGAEIHYHSTTTRSPLTLPITFTPGPREGAGGAA